MMYKGKEIKRMNSREQRRLKERKKKKGTKVTSQHLSEKNVLTLYCCWRPDIYLPYNPYLRSSSSHRRGLGVNGKQI